MPKTAFWKLPYEKQDYFIETSIREFSNQSYDNVSVKYISEKLGIAKGTLYKYFENKKDLYLFLVEVATAQKYEAVDHFLKQTPKDDFSEVLYQIYLSNTRFEINFPLLSRFLYCVHRENPHHELGNLPLLLKKQASNHYRAILHAQQQEGRIRSDIPLEALAFLVVQSSWGIRDYFLAHHPAVLNEQSKNKASAEKVGKAFSAYLAQLVNEGFFKHEAA
ncbi:MAG TPA: hypothetical protein DCS93_26440 [Microscillaceae bacterium]|nr:hypothetical protein [Microscillaceae bacterium]